MITPRLTSSNVYIHTEKALPRQDCSPGFSALFAVNTLPDSVVQAPSIEAIKNRLVKLWKEHHYKTHSETN